jgi:hypothetical protein
MAARTNLQVTLLLNIQRRWGDTTIADQLVRRYADRFWKVEWPGTLRPRVFYDPRALDRTARPASSMPKLWSRTTPQFS